MPTDTAGETPNERAGGVAPLARIDVHGGELPEEP
jgi:hypothetical protein